MFEALSARSMYDLWRIAMPQYNSTIVKRFWAKVDRCGPTIRPELGCCWIWTGSRVPKGYGHMGFHIPDGLVMKLSHRMSYELSNGAFPEHLHVLHLCDNPPCVRPEHLFLGDNFDNQRDSANKNRVAGAKLSLGDVRVIREYAKQPRDPGWAAYLADQFGITEKSIHRIVRRERYRYV